MSARRIALVITALAALVASRPASADCLNPAGGAGAMIYNTEYHDMQFCDGTQWQAIGQINTMAGPGYCSNPTRDEGVILYNIDHQMMQFCNGTDWIAMVGSGAGGGGSGPTASDGYFALAGSTQGNLGGLTGANSYCLNELTNSDWKGKSTAVANGQLVAGKVRAFLCDNSTCQNGQPNTIYYFASTSDPDTGGGYMTTQGCSTLPDRLH